MPADDTGQVPGNYQHWFITSPLRCLGDVCGLCIEKAPENFGWQVPYADRAEITRQPLTELENNNMFDAAVACPPQIISTGEPE